MPSLLDFLGGAGGGLLGNLGGGYDPQDEAQAARDAAAQRLQQMMAARARAQPPAQTMQLGDFIRGLGGAPSFAPQGPAQPQPDPFNAPFNPMPFQGAQPPIPASPLGVEPPPQPQGSPPAGPNMPVSLPTGAGIETPPASPAAGAAQPSFGSGKLGSFGDMLNQNSATLMALGGGIAQHGIGGFADAAKVALAERALRNKPDGEFMGFPYKMVNGQMHILTPGGGTVGLNSLSDLINFKQKIAAQGAAATATATKQAAAAPDLQTRLDKLDEIDRDINDLKNHPGKKYATGPIAGATPKLFGDQSAFIGKLDALKAKVQQQAMLGGQSPGEAKALADSIDLNRTGDIDQSLNDLQRSMAAERARAGTRAGGAPTPRPAAPASGGWSVTRVQ